MKKFYIAIDNEEKFKEIKKYIEEKGYFVFQNDLIYEDAVLEVIKNIDNTKENILLISSNIIENINKYKKINVENLKIYYFVDTFEEKDNFEKNGLTNIFDKADLNTFFIMNKIIRKDSFKENRFEINRFNKNRIDNKDNQKGNVINNIDLLKKEIKELECLKGLNERKNLKSEIIVFTGEAKCGKTTLALSVLENIKEEKNILFIDFNLRSKDIYYKYNISNKNESFYEKEINGNKVDFLLKMNYLLKTNDDKKQGLNKDIGYKMRNILDEYRNKYDLIIIDLDKNIDYKILKSIFLKTNKIFFVIEPINLEIYNSLNLIELFLNKNIINEDKVFIIFNKYDYNSISQEILKEIFKKYKIECIVKNKMKYRKILNKEVKYEYRVRR